MRIVCTVSDLRNINPNRSVVAYADIQAGPITVPCKVRRSRGKDSVYLSIPGERLEPTPQNPEGLWKPAVEIHEEVSKDLFRQLNAKAREIGLIGQTFVAAAA